MNDIHSNIIKEDLISNNNSISNSQNIFYNSIMLNMKLKYLFKFKREK